MDDFVAKHLAGVSRTYAILVPMLPAPLDQVVGVAYLVMRIVDTLEDAPELTTAERLRCFTTLEQALGAAAMNGQAGPAAQVPAPSVDDAAAAPALAQPVGDAAAQALARPVGESADERALMEAIPDVLARFAALQPEQRAAIRACAGHMMAGVRKLIARAAERGLPYPAVRDLPELREYCYYVAGVVGEMLCALMADHLRHPALLNERARAVELGLGLQLVNILKDARADAAHGRRYLPSLTDRTDPTDLPDPTDLTECTGTAAVATAPEAASAAPRERAADVYQMALREARRCLHTGIDYVLALPPAATDLRAFCGLPIAWGGLTLARAAADPAAAKIDRAAVQATLARFDELAADDARLRAWLLSAVAAGD